MLGGNVARRRPRHPADQARQPVALGFDIEPVRQVEQPRRSAMGDQRPMELIVPFVHRVHVDGVHFAGEARLPFDLQAERMEGGHDGGFPVIVAVAHRSAQRFGFDQDAGFRRVLHFLARQRRDGKTAQRRREYQPLGLQPHQRLAQRRKAQAVALLQRFEPQRLARVERAGDDVGAQALIGDFAQRCGLAGSLADDPAPPRLPCSRLSGRHRSRLQFLSKIFSCFEHISYFIRLAIQGERNGNRTPRKPPGRRRRARQCRGHPGIARLLRRAGKSGRGCAVDGRQQDRALAAQIVIRPGALAL